MAATTLAQFLSRLLGMPPVWIALWIGLVGLSIALLLLMRTRWGQSRPLHKCAVLSLIAHLLLAGFATTVRIVSGAAGPPPSPSIHVTISSPDAAAQAQSSPSPRMPWDPVPVDPEMPLPDQLDAPQPADPQLMERPDTLDSAAPLPEQIAAENVGPAEADVRDLAANTSASDLAPVEGAVPIEKPERGETQPAESPLPEPQLDPEVAAQSDEQPDSLTRDPAESLPTQLPEDTSTAPQVADAPSAEEAAGLSSATDLPLTATSPVPLDQAGNPNEPPLTPVGRGNGASESSESSPPLQTVQPGNPGDGPPLQEVGRHRTDDRAIPEIYKNRISPRRDEIVNDRGGSGKTEEAVRSALQWLAANQEPGGRWNPARHGAGRELVVLGHDRGGAGAKADTGITALALLAYLGAGHTHLEGEHRDTVLRGLEFLMRSQAADGSLAGDAELYARMYCHAMASFALSEAFAMTGDAQLEPAVTRAVRYSVAAQHRQNGGWRYQPGDQGDTSQLGWQVMALKSAQLAGVSVPAETWTGVGRFLRSVASGSDRGLASYQPRRAPSRTMTAEALFCRQLLHEGNEARSTDEAVQFLLAELPGAGYPDLYYWYYGTLALYQEQGEAWRQWNEALVATLLVNQQTEGAAAGSWNPDTRWGGYGGRVYSTAMAALCLEVYYRYLPLLEERTPRRPR
ncbi:MAG: squalene--hopene cyclase [Pirellulales bacterium]